CDQTAIPARYTLSLHDALPIFGGPRLIDVGAMRAQRLEYRDVARAGGEGESDAVVGIGSGIEQRGDQRQRLRVARRAPQHRPAQDRKSTRLNSSHGSISYAVFC